MRFSIIVPVYNVEKYIRKCMDSIMNQTFRDFEVIVVDDESPDNSMQIVQEFAEKYPGVITMIRQKNTGLGGARNRGVREARGEYLIFVDSDDYVRLDMLECINAQLNCHDSDIFIFKFLMVTPDGIPLREEGFGPVSPGFYIPSKHKQIIQMPVSAVNKVYRRSFYVECEFRFLEGVLYEDTITRFLMAKAAGIYLYDAVLYYYVQSPGSIIRRKPSAHVLDILKVSDIVLSEFRKSGIYEEFQEELDASVLTSILYVFNTVNKSEKHSPLQDAFASYIEKKFPDYEKNPSILKENKAAIRCILRKNYTWYHFRFLLKLELIESLMGIPAVAKLNRWRKRLLCK